MSDTPSKPEVWTLRSDVTKDGLRYPVIEGVVPVEAEVIKLTEHSALVAAETKLKEARDIVERQCNTLIKLDEKWTGSEAELEKWKQATKDQDEYCDRVEEEIEKLKAEIERANAEHERQQYDIRCKHQSTINELDQMKFEYDNSELAYQRLTQELERAKEYESLYKGKQDQVIRFTEKIEKLENELERANEASEVRRLHLYEATKEASRLSLLAVLNRDKLLKAFAVAIGVKDASGWSTGISILKELGFEDEAEWVLSEQGEKE